MIFCVSHVAKLGHGLSGSFMQSAAICSAAILIFTWTVFCGIKVAARNCSDFDLGNCTDL